MTISEEKVLLHQVRLEETSSSAGLNILSHSPSASLIHLHDAG